MKLHNLLLAAALFLSAGTAAFAVDPATPQQFFSIEKTDNMKTLDIYMFRMNEGWNYSISGYTAETPEGGVEDDESEPTLVLSYKSNLSGTQYLEAKTKKKVQAFIKAMDKNDLPEDTTLLASLNQHATSVYHFSVPIPEDVEEIGLVGGNGNGNTTDSIYNKSAINGSDFYVVDNVVYFGKAQWIDHYNNGAVFVVGVKGTPVGSPLPTPVVTLLIALGLGAALVMYRNRKQVKA